MNGPISIIARPNRKYEIQNGVLQTGSTYISACRQNSNDCVFGVRQHGETSGNTVQCSGLSEIQRWRSLTRSRHDITHLSASIPDIETEFQRLYPCFRDRTTRLDYCEDCLTCRFVRNQRWRPGTGSR